MEIKIISCETHTKKELDKIRCDLVKVIYSDINGYKDFGSISKIHATAILKQLIEFRLKNQYAYPKFVLYSDINQFKKCYDLLVTGKTLIEVEAFYFNSLINKQAHKRKVK